MRQVLLESQRARATAVQGVNNGILAQRTGPHAACDLEKVISASQAPGFLL